jgi:hypothetical protein
MGPLVVVEADPFGDHAAGMLQVFEAGAMLALLLERSDHPLDHPVLFWAVGRDELLLQAIALDQGRLAAAGKDQPIVRVQQEGPLETRPRQPYRAIRACSRAASAVLERPLRLRCQPSSSRL